MLLVPIKCKGKYIHAHARIFNLIILCNMVVYLAKVSHDGWKIEPVGPDSETNTGSSIINNVVSMVKPALGKFRKLACVALIPLLYDLIAKSGKAIFELNIEEWLREYFPLYNKYFAVNTVKKIAESFSKEKGWADAVVDAITKLTPVQMDYFMKMVNYINIPIMMPGKYSCEELDNIYETLCPGGKPKSSWHSPHVL